MSGGRIEAFVLESFFFFFTEIKSYIFLSRECIRIGVFTELEKSQDILESRSPAPPSCHYPCRGG